MSVSSLHTLFEDAHPTKYYIWCFGIPIPTCRAPPPLVRVPGLIHLEILLYHLHSINNLLIFDYPSVTPLTVTVLASLLQYYTQDL